MKVRLLPAEIASVLGFRLARIGIMLLTDSLQRQTVVSQFYQNDRLVVEGGMAVGVEYTRALNMQGGGLTGNCRASRRASLGIARGKRIQGKKHVITRPVVHLLTESSDGTERFFVWLQ